ncbi:MAG: pyridoxal phosphate-dependent aminotransferase family protein [Deltaproteobacteria bacterium]|nr:pyridoxal phosphate-dependent aminotransferase family protein [Deltaproteobacteria bacterium]
MANQGNLAEVQEHPNIDSYVSFFTKGGKDVFANAYNFQEAEMAKQFNMYPYYQVIDRNEAATCVIEGRETIMLGSNNYLGLTIHPEVRQAAIKAIAEHGPSLTGSRILNGTHRLHLELEEQLAGFLGKESCLVFTTGYQANLGFLSAFLKKGTMLAMDKGDHASIYDGARLGKGETVGFAHNNPADLDRVLSAVPDDIGKMVMVDGVFSMEGDVVDLPQIQKVAQKYQARLVVDDAHGIGVMGPGGRGTVSHFNLNDKVDIIIGTFSKTLASIGGFVAGEAKVIDFIKHFGRPMVFSASLPPASAAAALKALEILKREPERVGRVNANAHYLRENLLSRGFNLGHSQTPIMPIIVGDEIITLTLWRELLNEGIYVNSVLYPAVPREMSLLRMSVTSEHTREQLDKVVAALVKLKNKHRW